MPAGQAEAFLKRAEVVRLGLVDAQGPYIVPVNFGYASGRLYVHGPAEGRRLDAMIDEPRICFEADEGEIVRGSLPCDFTSRFSSVIGYGVARVLVSAEEKRHGLDVIMRHYGGTGDRIADRTLEVTSVVEIVIESMEGKRYLPAPAGEGE